jgi:hypothetical protein
MIDNLFTSSPAVWGSLIAGLVALPILIHLINLLRHKTVKWAAMEFLLKSHKKNKNWVWLKQMLLLLSRIAALLLALFMLSQIGCEDDRISKLLGGATTHHYVILDDSFSMSDRGTGGSAFDKARSTLSQIASRARNRQNQLFSIVRYSMAKPRSEGQSGTEDSEAAQSYDLSSELVDNLFDQRIEGVKGRLEISSLSVGIDGALESVSQLIRERSGENAIVYVLSDFRQRDWDNVDDVADQFQQIHSAGAGIELINCSPSQRPNLAITQLEAIGNVRVAEAPVMMKVTVKNCSDSTADKVQVQLGSLAFPNPDSKTLPSEIQPDFVEIPTVFIQSIPPGESETRTFPVYFNTPGKHVVFGSLPEDSVAIDNQRWNVTEFSTDVKVLMVDDESRQQANYLSLAISPGGMTGISPEIQTKSYLRDTSQEQLGQFDVIFLLGIDSLDESAVKNLELFVQAGGGCAFFLGPNTNLNAFNTTLYRNGEGVFPMPISRVFDVPELIEDRVPDISPNQHPMFAPVLGVKNSLLDLVQVNTMVQPPIEWDANDQDDVTIAASVRGVEGWPLAVEKNFGKGRVIAWTSSAGPVWNNWSRNATFPPILLLMQDYLAAGNYLAENRLVGTPINIELPSESYTPELTLLAPVGGKEERFVNQMKLSVSPTDSGTLEAIVGRARETDLPGIYDLWVRRTDSSRAVERYTLNVDTGESELAVVNQQKLLSQLEQSKPTLVNWDAFNPEPKQKPTSSLAKLLLLLLVIVLIAEQLLAYSTSYHAKPSRS